MSTLLVSLHDVTPHYAPQIERIVGMLERLDLLGRTTMLLVPHFHHKARFDVDPAFAARVRDWADRGVEMALHGYFHLDETTHLNPIDAWKSRKLTNREGEFLGLGYVEARRRIDDGMAMIEQACGIAPDGFVAPAWLYSDDAWRAVRDAGFAWAEDRWAIRDFRSGRRLAPGLAVTFRVRDGVASRTALPWANLAPRVFDRLRADAIRWAIHPADANSDALMATQERVLRRLCSQRNPMRYIDYVGVARA
jgi:predicted deacetylase